MAKKKADTPASATEPATRQVVKRAPRTTSATTTKRAAQAETAATPGVEAAPKTVARRPAKPKAALPTPTYDQIARVAYEIHLERGGQHGFHFEDWLEAETRLRSGR